MKKQLNFTLLFISLYVFRVLFGLSHPFYGLGEIDRDSLQTYLIGLKYYTTGFWPFFGPDQYHLDSGGYYSQIPGALEGVVVGWPFHLLPIPETPFLVLNFLSLSALAFLACYISRRLPELSFLFVFAWIALLPWTLNLSTHVFNPSYLLCGSVLFFVSFLEALPGLTLGWMRPSAAFWGMGLAIGWNMQFHYSWVLLPPLVLLAFVWRRKDHLAGWGKEVGWGFLGLALPLVFLIPTYFNYGFNPGSSGIAHGAEFFNFKNFKDFPVIMARYLSFPCFEIPRFIGTGSGERWQFFRDAPWLWPPGVFLIVFGVIQPFALLFAGWFEDKRHPQSREIGYLTLFGLLWIWFCFWFTSNGEAAHMYYVFFPLVTIYFFYVWVRFINLRWWKPFAWVCLCLSLWFQTGFMIHQFQKGNTIYSDRARIVKAIEEKDYRILSERRPWKVFY